MMIKNEFIAHWNADFKLSKGPALLAVSGGADSMVMAHLFLSCGLDFAVAHCNFCLRGVEADKDEALVKDWCSEQNIAFYFTRFNTAYEAEMRKKGIQETARELRYDWLNNLVNEYSFSCLATAHHANDNAETLLMHLFKGTGIKGLHGIPPQNGKVVRPLLFAEKNDILAYAKENGVPYRDDASNFSDAYLRNAIRLKLMPVAEDLFGNAVQKLIDSISNFRKAEAVYDLYIQEKLESLCEKRGKDIYIPIKKLLKYPVADTLLYEACKPYGFLSAQAQQIFGLCHAESGKYVGSATHMILRNRDFLIISNKIEADTDLILIDSLPRNVVCDGKTYNFSKGLKPASLPTDKHIAYMDMAQISMPLLLRRRKNGDYFYPLGMKMKKKKLSNFLIDTKVPLHEKDALFVVETNKRIAWVAGHRLDERFKIKDSTKEILRIEIS
jgi:tRNA(Ile)-lysidine synthase